MLQAPQPLARKLGLGSSGFAHRYLRNRYYFLFLQVLRCFTSLSSLPHRGCLGFPHSEICASMPVSGFAQLIAACHVLPRRSSPRHPPFALSSLTLLIMHRLLELPLSLTAYSIVEHYVRKNIHHVVFTYSSLRSKAPCCNTSLALRGVHRVPCNLFPSHLVRL